MKRKLQAGVLCLSFVLIPLWTTWTMFQVRTRVNASSVIDSQISSAEITLFVHGSIFLMWLLVTVEFIRNIKFLGSFASAQALLRLHPKHMLLSALALTPMQSGTSSSQVSSIPTTTAITPIIASSILSDILRRRREQVHQKIMPRRFLEVEQQRVQTLATCSKSTGPVVNTIDFMSESDVVELMAAVEEIEVLQIDQREVVHQWHLIVRLYGYPQVENQSGTIATFRKKRALELISWLSVNRDRARRSSARTALWDIDVSDASFATVVSDMRRSLADVAPCLSRDELVPTTYTDEIPVHALVTSDFDLLVQAHAQFKRDSTSSNELADALSLIRDMPFAGTAYSWADYDGTTTRLIVTAVEAAIDLGGWALKNNQTELAQIAVKAGLRVMPGCEELLEIHKSLLPKTQTSRHRVSH